MIMFPVKIFKHEGKILSITLIYTNKQVLKKVSSVTHDIAIELSNANPMESAKQPPRQRPSAGAGNILLLAALSQGRIRPSMCKT